MAVQALRLDKKILPREDIHSRMLLALARYWRNCAAQSNEQWRRDMMRCTAEEFENAAARAARQGPAAPPSGCDAPCGMTGLAIQVHNSQGSRP
jgi:hypothetical protein